MTDINPYFSIGDAVAAVLVLIGVFSFQKPIYKTRIRMIGIKIRNCIILIALAVFMVIGAAVLGTNPELSEISFLCHPLLWESLACCMMIGLVIRITLASQRVVSVNAENIGILAHDIFYYINSRDLGEMLALSVEIEESMEQIFYLARMEVKNDKGGQANGILTMLSDPSFCKMISERNPRFVYKTMLAAQYNNDRVGYLLIKNLFESLISSEDSLLKRELNNEGPGKFRINLRNIFDNIDFLASEHRPLRTVFDYFIMGKSYRHFEVAVNILEYVIENVTKYYKDNKHLDHRVIDEISSCFDSIAMHLGKHQDDPDCFRVNSTIGDMTSIIYNNHQEPYLIEKLAKFLYELLDNASRWEDQERARMVLVRCWSKLVMMPHGADAENEKVFHATFPQMIFEQLETTAYSEVAIYPNLLPLLISLEGVLERKEEKHLYGRDFSANMRRKILTYLNDPKISRERKEMFFPKKYSIDWDKMLINLNSLFGKTTISFDLTIYDQDKHSIWKQL